MSQPESKSERPQVVPQTKSSRSKLQRASDQVFMKTGMSLGRLVSISLACLVVAGSIFYLVYFKPEPAPDTRPDRPAVVNTKEQRVDALVDALSTEEIFGVVRSLPVRYVSLPAPLKMEEINTRINMLEKLRGSELSDEDFGRADQYLLRYYMIHDGLLVEFKADRTKSEKRLREFASSMLKSSDANVVNSAQFALSLLPLRELGLKYSPEGCDNAIAAVEKYGDGAFANLPEVKDMANMLASLARRQPNDPKVMKLQQTYATKVQASANPEIRAVGEQMFDDLVFGGVSLEVLRIDIAKGISDSLGRYRTLLDLLSNNPNVSEPAYQRIVSINESLLTVERAEEAKRVNDYLLSLLPKVTDEAKRANIAKYLSRQAERIGLLGNPIDLAGNAWDGTLLEQTGKPTAVIFWSSQDANASTLMMKMVNAFPTTRDEQFKILAVTAEPLLEEGKARIPGFRTRLKFGSDELSRKLFERCPVDVLPYVLIVDSEGKVAAMNVSLTTIEDRLRNIR